MCFLYREVPESEEDSGWRVFSGEEDQAYADDPANLGLYAVSTVVAIDPSIAPLLRTPAPCAFERESPASPFCATDFGFEPEE